jgi:hypothetical protein
MYLDQCSFGAREPRFCCQTSPVGLKGVPAVPSASKIGARDLLPRNEQWPERVRWIGCGGMGEKSGKSKMKTGGVYVRNDSQMKPKLNGAFF